MFVVSVVEKNKSRDVSSSMFVFQLMKLKNIRTYSEWSDPRIISGSKELANKVMGIVLLLGESV